jgi:hypothetical protein
LLMPCAIARKHLRADVLLRRFLEIDPMSIP